MILTRPEGDLSRAHSSVDFDASVVSWSCHHTRTRPRNPASGSRLVATPCASPSPPRHPPPRRPHCGLIFGRTSRKRDCTVRNVLRLSVARVLGRLLSSADSCSAAWSRHRCVQGTGACTAQVRTGHRCAQGTGVHTAQVCTLHRCLHGTGAHKHRGRARTERAITSRAAKIIHVWVFLYGHKFSFKIENTFPSKNG